MTSASARSVTTAARGRPRAAAPTELPDRQQLISTVLDQSGRGGVPIRRTFLQLAEPDESGHRGSVLAQIVKSRDVAALDAYLILHAAASSEPWHVSYAAAVWTRILGFDVNAEPAAARTHWAKVATKLVSLSLIMRHRQGNRRSYQLLDESGDGTPYERPNSKEEPWFSLPYAYWRDGHHAQLNLPEKAMLLIVIDQRAGHSLPYERMPSWYGISASTAKRGLTGLAAKGLISADTDWRVDPKSPIGWAEVRRYTPQGAFAADARRAAMQVRPKKSKPVMFLDQDDENAVPGVSP